MTARGPIRALVYGDVNLNAIDGSAIWAVSTVETLARAGCQVTLLLKTRVRRSTLLEPLERLENVVVVSPFEEGRAAGQFDEPLSLANAVAVMRELDETSPFDLVLIRGFGLATRIVDSGAFDGRLWTYLTDLPQSVTAMDEEAFDRLTDIAGASRYVLCQTEELRTFLEGAVPAACGRCVLFPPVVPEPNDPPPPSRFEPGQTLKLVYSGKFAPDWNTLEMTTPARRCWPSAGSRPSSTRSATRSTRTPTIPAINDGC